MVAFLPVLALLGACGQKTETQADLDGGVIRASAEHLFDLPPEFCLDGNRGAIIVIRPEYRGDRPDVSMALIEGLASFKRQLASIQDRLKHPKNGDDRKRLALYEDALQKRIKAISNVKVSPARVNTEPSLNSLTLGSRVSVSDQQRSSLGANDGNIRAFLTLSPPGFSSNLDWAVVKGWFPWSMHSGEVTFFLHRKGRVWKVVAMDTVHYV